MDTTEQITPQGFQIQCQAFVERLITTLNNEDTLGVTVNGALHFAGFLIAQHIQHESTHRFVDFQEEVSVAVGVFANATAHNLHNMQGRQVGTVVAANKSFTKH